MAARAAAALSANRADSISDLLREGQASVGSGDIIRQVSVSNSGLRASTSNRVGIDVAVGGGWRVVYTFSESISGNPLSAQVSPLGQSNLANFRISSVSCAPFSSRTCLSGEGAYSQSESATVLQNAGCKFE